MAKKDIFDIFREKAAELEQEPTPQAWSRIERRIQSARPTVRRTPMRRLPRPLGIAAGLALLMGLSVVFLWLADAEQRQAVALAQHEGPLEVEELVIASADDEVVEVVEIAQAHPLPKSAKPIIEGQATQRLVAKNESRAPRMQVTPSPSDSTFGESEQRTGR